MLWKLRHSVRDPSTSHQEKEREKTYCLNYSILLGIRPLHIKGYTSKETHQGLPSVGITPKLMTYRDTEYLKIQHYKEQNRNTCKVCHSKIRQHT